MEGQGGDDLSGHGPHWPQADALDLAHAESEQERAREQATEQAGGHQTGVRTKQPIGRSPASSSDQANASSLVEWEEAAERALVDLSASRPALQTFINTHRETILTNHKLQLKQRWNNLCRTKAPNPMACVATGRSTRTGKQAARHPASIAVPTAEEVILEYYNCIASGQGPKLSDYQRRLNERDEARNERDAARERVHELEHQVCALEIRVSEAEAEKEEEIEELRREIERLRVAPPTHAHTGAVEVQDPSGEEEDPPRHGSPRPRVHVLDLAHAENEQGREFQREQAVEYAARAAAAPEPSTADPRDDDSHLEGNDDDNFLQGKEPSSQSAIAKATRE